MAANEVSTPLTGDELLEFINSRNTKQAALGSVSDIADYIRELGIPAEVLMIVLLQDIKNKLDEISYITKEQKLTNMYLSKITGEKFTCEDIEE